MKIIALTLQLCLAASLGVAQGPQTKADHCSVALNGSGNQVTISSCALSAAQMEELRLLLNRIIVQREAAPSDVLAILDELKNGQARIENGILALTSQMASKEYAWSNNCQLRVERTGTVWMLGLSEWARPAADAYEAKQWTKLLPILEMWTADLAAQVEKANLPSAVHVTSCPAPYLMRGDALANLGATTSAIANYKLFVSLAQYQDEFRDEATSAQRTVNLLQRKQQ